jgi:hypothetical protein
MRLRDATDADFWRLCRTDPPAHWFGQVVERDGVLLGLGVVFWDLDGKAWVSVARRGRVPTITAHRAVRKVLASLAEIGEREARTFCDENIPGARLWLQRLGFVEGETINGRTVWIWRTR